MERKINLSEENLRTDLNVLSAEIVHDFYVFFRKAGIYAASHPLVKKAVSRPFLSLQKMFGFKQYFSFILTEGRLFANNILLSDAPSTEYLKTLLQELEIRSLLFEETITADELLLFADRFVRRLPAADPDHSMGQYLARRKVATILVNHDLAAKLFETGLRYRGDVCEDFSVRRLVANHFSGEVDLAITILNSQFENTAAQAAAVGIDFHTEIVDYILPEKFAQMPPAELLEIADKLLSIDPARIASVADKLTQLIRSCDYHPRRERLLDELQRRFAGHGLAQAALDESALHPARVKQDVATAIDDILATVFSTASTPELYERFHDAFMRLLRTRQTGKAAKVVESLVEQLASDDSAFRLHAVCLIQDCTEAALSLTEHEFLDVIGRHLQYLFTRGRETFEFAEVAGGLMKAMLSLRRYEPTAAFLNVIKGGRQAKDDVTVYDSAAVKKIFEGLNQRDLINRMVRELQLPGNDQARYLHEILVAIQTEEVALQLAEIVAHPDRAVRQRCLRALSELGRPAVKIFSSILWTETNFYRPGGRRDLPDSKWFLIRNSIFVLGNLRDPFACGAFRLRLADPDVRVRLEIVRALEKIGDDEAADLLMILAEDTDTIVREAAIITLGLFKRSDLVPFFADLMTRQKGEIARIISAIAQSGSAEGRDFLLELLEDSGHLRQLASGKASADDIRLFIAKGLEKIGDEVALKKLDELKNKQGDNPKPPGELTFGKTAKIILSKIQPKK